jgi:hypothetical protein
MSAAATKPKERRGRSLARARPFTDGERARLRELHGAGLSCRQIASEMGRAPVTISRHAADLGLSFDRRQVREATAARVADLKARRAQVSAEFLDLAERINAHVRSVLGGPWEDIKPWHLRDYAYATAAYFDKHLAQAEHDQNDGTGLSEVDQWLEWMTGATPPASQGEHDDTAKVRSVLSGMAEALFAKYQDEGEGP